MKIRTIIGSLLKWAQAKIESKKIVQPTKDELIDWQVKQGLNAHIDTAPLGNGETKSTTGSNPFGIAYDDAIAYILIHASEDGQADLTSGKIIVCFKQLGKLDAVLAMLDPLAFRHQCPISIAKSGADLIAITSNRLTLLRQWTNNFASDHEGHPDWIKVGKENKEKMAFQQATTLESCQEQLIFLTYLAELELKARQYAQSSFCSVKE